MTPDPANDTPDAGAAADDVLTTEVIGSADSYRRVGEVFVSALAAIPAATLLTSLIRAPGDAGLSEWKLILGVLLAALAVAFGVALAVWLRTPVTVTTAELQEQSFSELVLTNQDDFDELVLRIDEVESAIGDATTETARLREQRQLAALIATLRRVQLVVTAKKLRERVTDWKTIALALLSLGCAAAAVAFLALAPKPKADAAPATTVVKVELTPDGAQLLGCPSSTFNGLKIGGTDDAPQVVPLGVTCTAGALLELTVADKTGTAKVSAIEAAAPTPTPTSSP
jgi:hypothetical protein